MKGFGAIVFILATACSLVMCTPIFHNERRAIMSEPFALAARALELVPRVKLGSRASNGTEHVAKSLIAKNTNSSSNVGGENKARSLLISASANANATAESGTPSLVGRQATNATEAETTKRSPLLRRANFFGLRSASNETSA
ncbi:hypothetical protein F4804DRAFT_43740 [Jackrogersella minutella]|nr:hypothetical protein F4804DRAFT_43740 [Jackrogersella minutella]